MKKIALITLLVAQAVAAKVAPYPALADYRRIFELSAAPKSYPVVAAYTQVFDFVNKLETYPFPMEHKQMLGQDAADRIVYAPFYAELPGRPGRNEHLGNTPEKLSTLTLRKLFDPAYKMQQVEITAKLKRPFGVPDELQLLEHPDPFTIGVTTDWNAPYDRWLKQTLKDIKVAKQAGDTETYKRLTASYVLWAEKYLRRAEADE